MSEPVDRETPTPLEGSSARWLNWRDEALVIADELYRAGMRLEGDEAARLAVELTRWLKRAPDRSVVSPAVGRLAELMRIVHELRTSQRPGPT